MAIKFKIDKNVQKALGVTVQNGKIVRDNSVLVPEVRKEFRASGVKPIRKALLRDMTKGISPVSGYGKFKKYSKSYKNLITGTSIAAVNLQSASSPKKRRSPVTLRLTGALHNALKVFTSGGFTETFRLVFDWRDFLADIHNRRGAGKKQVVRRMLPTESGESFNAAILKVILDRLNKAAKLVAKKFS